MAGFEDNGLNAAVDAITGLGDWIALFEGDPDGGGGTEVTGGSPAYSREQSTFAGAASGTDEGSEVTFDVPAGADVTHWAIMTASTAGSRVYSDALPAPESFGGQGVFRLTPTVTATNA